jgi:hypothetical protein
LKEQVTSIPIIYGLATFSPNLFSSCACSIDGSANYYPIILSEFSLKDCGIGKISLGEEL